MIYRLRNLTKQLRQPDGRFLLHIPELIVEPRQVYVFHGPSGCGKSTLFDILGLISTPTFAENFEIVAGNDPGLNVMDCSEGKLSRLRASMVGYVIQLGGLVPSLTVADNIALPLSLRGLPAPRQRIAALAERLGILEQLKKKPAALSGGQKQRVAIARAIIHKPAVILADEPTGSVDPCLALEIRDLLVGCAVEEGAAVMVVTHDHALFRDCATQSFTFHVAKDGAGVTSTLSLLPA